MSADEAHTAGRSRSARLRVVLRPVMTLIVLLTAYYVLPWDPSPAILLVLVAVALVGLGVLLWWQVGASSRALFPQLRALEALATAVLCFVMVFAGTYVGLSRADPGAFTEAVDRTDGLYFAVAVLGTVGFGDIAPLSQTARIAVLLQMVSGLVLVGVVAKLFLGAVRARRHAPSNQAPGGPYQ